MNLFSFRIKFEISSFKFKPPPMISANCILDVASGKWQVKWQVKSSSVIRRRDYLYLKNRMGSDMIIDITCKWFYERSWNVLKDNTSLLHSHTSTCDILMYYMYSIHIRLFHLS